MRWLLTCLSLAACDATTTRAPTTSATPAASASPPTAAIASSAPPAPSAPSAASLAFTLSSTLPWSETRAPARAKVAFSPDGRTIVLGAAHTFVAFDAQTLSPRPMPHAPPVTHSTRPLVVFGDAAIEADTGAEVVLAMPKGAASCSQSFSNDGRSAGLDCTSSDAYPCPDPEPHISFDVVDVATGAVTRHFQHPRDCDTAFLEETHGAITASGRFVKWTTREAAAFEDLRKPGPGYPLASEATLSPDDGLLFTTEGRYDRGLHQVWLRGPSPAKMVDPRNGRRRFDLPTDVTSVVFSPSGKLFVAVHARIAPPYVIEPRSLTLHASDGAKPLLTIPLARSSDAPRVASSADDRALAVAEDGELRVYRAAVP